MSKVVYKPASVQLNAIQNLDKLCLDMQNDNQAMLRFFVDMLRNTNPKEITSQEIDGRFCKIIGKKKVPASPQAQDKLEFSVVLQFSEGRMVESVYAGPLNSEGKAQTEMIITPQKGQQMTAEQQQGSAMSKGLMIFERGQGRYFGGWHNGRYSGLGSYDYKLGISYEGGFLDGLMHGHGKFCWPVTVGDGNITFIGEFENDRRVKGKVFDGQMNLI